MLHPQPPLGSRSVDLERVVEANHLIKPYIKRTPLMEAVLPNRSGERVQLALKLENLQVGGSVQVRGMLNAVLQAPDDTVSRGLVIVRFGGRHDGAAAAYIAALLDVPVSVFFPRVISRDRVAQYQVPRMKTYIYGNSWEAAARRAAEQAARHGQIFLHPFADPVIVAGLGTLGLEILDAPLRPDVVVVPAYTSGSELCGIATAIKSMDSSIRVIGVEAEGAARLHESLLHGRPTRIRSPGPSRPSDLTFDLARRFVDEVVVVTAREARDGVQMLWRELEVSASISAATAVAAVLAGKIRMSRHDRVLAVVSGTGKEGLF
jgi:threonine dehydratase